jgi:hypothetical protein
MPERALQLTVHDYSCSDYCRSKATLAQITTSLRGPSAEA